VPHVPVPVTGVTLNASAKTVNAGSTFQLTATVAPTNADNKAMTWSSGDTAVAMVDANGLVTAKAEGTAAITVKTADGNKTAQCVITVPRNVAKPVINGSANVTLEYRASMQLPVIGDGLTWSGGNKYISVDQNGIVTSQKQFWKLSSATIQARNSAGSVEFSVKVRPSFVQWLMIIFLFGWLWM
jgi:uncharacterized protein YjdB